MKPIIYQLLVRLAGNRKGSGKPFGTIEENGCGKFNDLSSHFLENLKEFGITHLWLTGVLEHASCTDYSAFGIKADNPLVIKGRAGSPYAIKDYYDVCPDLAEDINNRMQEFERLLKRCQEVGLDTIIDFVPNHVARAYKSDNKPDGISDLGENDNKDLAFHPRNNFYYLPGHKLRLPYEIYELPYVKEIKPQPFEEYPAKATGNDHFTDSPSINDWYETIKLNYGVDYQDGGKKYFDPLPDSWGKMLDILLFWASKGVKGFRCDMAEMVPVEFWEWAIKKVKEKFPGILFIAEIYNPAAYRSFIETGGFDFLYDKDGLYDTLRAIMTGKQQASELSKVWQGLDGLDAVMLRFMENHDEQRIASPHFAGNPLAGIPAMAIAATMHQGPLLIYSGQELGEPAIGSAGYSGDDGRTTIFDYFHVPSFQQWFNEGRCNTEKLSEEQIDLRKKYQELLVFCQDEVITNGDFYDLEWYNLGKPGFYPESVYCYLRWNNKKIWLIAASFCQKGSLETTIRIPMHFFEISKLSQHENFEIKSIHNHTVLQNNIGTKDLTDLGIILNIEPFKYAIVCLDALN